MSLQLSSNSLTFKLEDALTKRADSSVELQAEDTDIAWKVMTNAPSRYRVKPTSGVLRARESVRVSLILSIPQGEAPDFVAWANDKFQVRCMALASASVDAPTLQQLWSSPSASITLRKIKCTHEFQTPPSDPKHHSPVASAVEAVVDSAAELDESSTTGAKIEGYFADAQTSSASRNLTQNAEASRFPAATLGVKAQTTKRSLKTARAVVLNALATGISLLPEQKHEMTVLGCSFAVAALTVKSLDSCAEWMLSGMQARFAHHEA